MATKKDIPSQKLLNNLYSAVEITKAALSDFANVIEDNAEDDEVVRCFDDFVRLSTDYVTALDGLSSQFAVYLNWLPVGIQNSSEDNVSHTLPSPHLELQYADGNSPWCFWLAYKQSPEFASLQKALQEGWKQGNLRRVSEVPPIGSYVLCTDRSIIFRGIILSTNNDKVKVRNIDNSCVKVLKLDNIFNMKRSLNTVHAQTVQCCLTKDNSLQSLWNADLSELFKNTLKENTLEVSFVEECADCIPAKFLVNLRAFGGETSVDLNDWICDKMLPELIKYQDRPEELTVENLSECIIDPFYTVINNMQSEDGEIENKIDFSDKSLVKMGLTAPASGWSSQLIMAPDQLLPCFLNPALASVHPGSTHLGGHILTPPGAITAQYTTTTLYGGSNMDGTINTFPQKMTTTSSFIVKTPGLSSTTLNVNTPIFEPRKKSDFTVSCSKKPLSLESNKTSCNLSKVITTGKSTDVSTKEVQTSVSNDSEICPKFSKNGYCLSSSCNMRHVKTEQKSEADNPSPQQQLLPCESSLKLKEKPKVVEDSGTQSTNKIKAETCLNYSSEKSSNNNEEILIEEDDEDLEEPCISGGYMPTDETRLCRFPILKNGRCWKPQCTKEHEESSHYKWTTDKHKSIDSTFNYLDLPEIGETIELIVTTVLNPFTFYARLPDIYSDIGEGVQNIETFRSLHKSLNDPKNIRSYQPLPDIEPAYGEMCLVRGLDNFWKRARILDSISKKSFSVFYIDYGNEETVPESALKLMEDRYNHLPAQAVRCSLSNLYCSLDDIELRQRGKKFLESTIKGKVITGKVINSNLEESSLDLLVTFETWNINNVMIQKGFCDQISSKTSS